MVYCFKINNTINYFLIITGNLGDLYLRYRVVNLMKLYWVSPLTTYNILDLETVLLISVPGSLKPRSDFCSDSDFRLRGVSPQTCGRGRSEQCKQILTLSIGKLFPIAYRYYYTHF